MLRTMKRLTALSFGTRQPEDSQKTRLTYSTETSENTNRQSFIHVHLCLCIRNRRTQTPVARFKASSFKVVRGANPARSKALPVKNHTRSHRACCDGEPDATTGANAARRARNRTIQFRTSQTHRHRRIASIASSSSSSSSSCIHTWPDSSPSENLVVHHPRRVASTLSNTYVSSRPGGLVAAVGTALLRHLRVLKQTYSRRRRRLTSSSVSIFPAESRATVVRIESTTRGRSSDDTREEDETRVRINSNHSLASSSSCSFKSSSSSHTHTYLSTRVRERRSRRIGASLLNSSGKHSFFTFGHLSRLKSYTVCTPFTFAHRCACVLICIP